ncbi:acyltransferase [Lactobacillus kalixensis]|uniref:Acyltransferase 3 domain-containing protein n=1 Tax=Lactobacillus kalixensis DSM 16043 TaxID=1423763 RepID=A0A0R1UJ96_9LACO|nr:acyltransferase family protein [Lactobacillus kalixensis]KRL91498.1 hypothetical protein FC46_GL000046 [Lactobacillus kalixensis DSM 16043]
MQKKRIHYLDILRILAIFGVIIIHVSSQQPFYAKNLHTVSWMGVNFWDSISRFSVPVFVMISGVLFLDPSRQVDMHRIFKKNIVRIITAFIFWDLFYAFYTLLFEQYTLRTLIKQIIRGYSHLWFLPMIVGLYLIVPFLRKIVSDQKLMKYYLVLALIFSILLPTFYSTYHALAKHLDWPLVVQLLVVNLEKLTNHIYFRFTLQFSTYFVAGYYLHQARFSKKARMTIYLLGLIGLAGGWAFTTYFSLKYNKPILPWYQYMSVPVAMASCGIFVGIRELGERINWEKHAGADKFLLLLSNLTFGIYLVHFIFVRILANQLNWFAYIPNTFIAVPLATIVIFIVSAVIMYFVAHIPWFNKHIM